MIYKKYGEIFRALRQQKKLSVSHFESIGISKATLAKFERGESMMGFDRVVLALQELSISLEEYEQILNNYTNSDQDELIERVIVADLYSDKNELLKLINELEQSGHSFLTLAAKSTLFSLNDIESEQIIDYLFSISIWGYMELSIFYLFLPNLSARETQLLINSFLIEKHPLLSSSKHRNKLLQIAYKSVILFSSRGYIDSAKYVINCIDNYHLEHDMFNQNLRNLSVGYWNFCFKNTSEGKLQIQKAIDIFNSLNLSEVSKYYQNMLDRL
ncbi:Rgg/GadR/MutR family transcriptional regulator [Lactococcus allomyrinae]|uniref:Rgg/GadR/MutR family transcriptional regulator n=1 Tax=Lactococcus allomyrinae TaxID=2419773 RepID=A0A387BDS8_9LACT|nr:Rgg/GadR/MutR family transcriptional regulator [Lactococcus allomyrinae]AYG00414.1 Rgg/GadR/MutR family transcriptional regulator [Lactococcus allomyrinae]